MNIISSFTSFGFQGDYFTDRLVRVYSTLLFIILAIVLATSFSRRDAITCTTPVHFTSMQHIYSQEVCLKEANLQPFMKDWELIPPAHNPDHNLLESFNTEKFQRFPIMLFFQSFLFLLPWLLWKLISGGACNLDAVIKEAAKVPTASTADSKLSVSGHLQKLNCNPCSLIGSTGGGFVLSLTYLFIKFFYWVICLAQMAAIANYFDFRYFSYMTGVEVWERYTHMEINENATQIVIPFPRDVMCDYQTIRLGNVQRYTIQCYLGISATVEDCLSVIWIWLVTVLVVLSLSGAAQFVQTILRCIKPTGYCKLFLKQRLGGIGSFQMASNEVSQKFIQQYMKPDMFFAIGMIEENGSLAAATSALRELWEDFLGAGKIHLGEQFGSRPAEDIQPICQGMPPTATGEYPEQKSVSQPANLYGPLQDQLKEAEAQM